MFDSLFTFRTSIAPDVMKYSLRQGDNNNFILINWSCCHVSIRYHLRLFAPIYELQPRIFLPWQATNMVRQLFLPLETTCPHTSSLDDILDFYVSPWPYYRWLCGNPLAPDRCLRRLSCLYIYCEQTSKQLCHEMMCHRLLNLMKGKPALRWNFSSCSAL